MSIIITPSNGKEKLLKTQQIYANFKKSYENGYFKKNLQQFVQKYFDEKPNGNKFPEVIMDFAKELNPVPLIVSKIKNQEIKDGYFEVNFTSIREYEEFLDLLAKMVIYFNNNGNSLGKLLDYEIFITFLLQYFPEIFGILDPNKETNNLHPDVQGAVSGVEKSVDGILEK